VQSPTTTARWLTTVGMYASACLNKLTRSHLLTSAVQYVVHASVCICVRCWWLTVCYWLNTRTVPLKFHFKATWWYSTCISEIHRLICSQHVALCVCLLIDQLTDWLTGVLGRVDYPSQLEHGIWLSSILQCRILISHLDVFRTWFTFDSLTSYA